jgi:hypothetical protein
MTDETNAPTRDQIHNLLETNATAVGRALLALRAKQTATEVYNGETIEHNGEGFNSVDAHILTSFADWYEAKGWLSPKQLKLARRKLTKYETQLTKIARVKAGLPEEAPKVRKPRTKKADVGLSTAAESIATNHIDPAFILGGMNELEQEAYFNVLYARQEAGQEMRAFESKMLRDRLAEMGMLE